MINKIENALNSKIDDKAKQEEQKRLQLQEKLQLEVNEFFNNPSFSYQHYTKEFMENMINVDPVGLEKQLELLKETGYLYIDPKVQKETAKVNVPKLKVDKVGEHSEDI